MTTSLARENLAKSEEFGCVIPTKIFPGKFVKLAADDNVDLNEETLDGKDTTHVTILVMYQNGYFGPLPKRKTYG